MISVIIPAWNESLELPEALSRLAACNIPHEKIIVDGGSTDDTIQIGERAGALIVSSPVRQRAFQLNLGASAASSESLLFLHADTWLNPQSLNGIEDALRSPEVVGGAFLRRFRSRSLFLGVTTRLAGIRNRCIGWHLGDQAIFARRAAFEKLAGYRLMNPFEDLDFSRRLRRLGRTVTLGPPVFSSARRFEKGAAQRSFADLVLTLKFIASSRRE